MIFYTNCASIKSHEKYNRVRGNYIDFRKTSHLQIDRRREILQPAIPTLRHMRSHRVTPSWVRRDITSGIFHSGMPRNYTAANFRTLVIIGLFVSVVCTPCRLPPSRALLSWRSNSIQPRSDLVVYAEFPIQEFDYIADPSAPAAGTSLAVGLHRP